LGRGRAAAIQAPSEQAGLAIGDVHGEAFERRLGSLREPEPGEGDEDSAALPRALSVGKGPRGKHESPIDEVRADQGRLHRPGSAQATVEIAPELKPEVVSVASTEFLVWNSGLRVDDLDAFHPGGHGRRGLSLEGNGRSFGAVRPLELGADRPFIGLRRLA
jgi:hypothetical protein